MWILIKRTINYYFKSSKEFIFLFIFPMVIMTAQYMMMEKVFNSKNENLYKDMKVYYEIKSEGEFTEEVLKNILQPLKGEAGTIKDVTKDTVLLQVDGSRIKVIYGSVAEESADIAINILNSYGRNKLVFTKSNGNNVDNIEVQSKFIKASDKVESKDYYGVTMMSIFLITVGSMSTGLISKDKLRGIKERLITLGVSNRKYYIGTTAGFMIIATIGLIPCYMYSYFILKTNWGGNLLIPYLSLIPFYLLFLSVFILVTAIFKSGEKVMGIVGGIAFPLLGGLGGAFFPIENYAPDWFNKLCYISPLKWYNDGIFDMVYKNQYNTLIVSTTVALLLGIIVTAITIIYSNRKEIMA